MLDSLAQVISALQGLETVFFVVLLCLLHLRLRREKFLVWWIWAWTAYGIALFAWWGALRPGMPFFPKETLVLTTILGGLLQIPLLIIGASNLPGQKPVEKRTWRLLLGLAVLAAVALYAASKQATLPRAQYAVWFLPRQTLLALGYFVCAGACMRWWQKAKSLGALVMAVSCGGYAAICLGYVGYQALALSYPLAVLLLDVACQNGIALGMVVQLVDAHKKAILARSESETKFGTMAECLGEGLLITDKDDVVLFLNRRLQEMTGYTKAELLGKSAYKYLVAPKQWPAIWQRNQERMQGASESYEIEFRRKDGTFVWAEVHATPYRNHAGEIVGTLGAITDITERKRSEEVFRTIAQRVSFAEGAQFFRSLVQHTAEALGADYCFVGELAEAGQEKVRTVAFWADGKVADNFEYHLANTPCSNVAGKDLCFYPQGAAKLFPQDRALAEMKIESYIGIPLFDSAQGALGLMVAMYRQPLSKPEMAQSLLRICAVRAGAELQRLRAEKALRASEERYREFVAHSSEAIWRIELEQPLSTEWPEARQLEHLYQHACIGECNDAMARLCGFPEARELVGRKLRDFLVASAEHEGYFRGAIRAGYRVENAESSETDREANKTYFLNTFVGIFEDGLLRRIWGTRRDITRRKAVEEALRLSETKFSKAFFASPDAVIISSFRDGIFLDVNESFLRMSGYRREEVIGRTSLELKIWERPEDRERAIQRLKEHGNIRNMEFEFRAKSGGVIVGLVSAEIIEFGGEPSMLAVVRDITDRKQMDEALKFSEQRYRELFENANDIIYTHDLAGNFTSLNRAGERITGFSRDEAFRMKIADVVVPEHRALAQQMVERKVKGEGSTTYELEILTKDKRRITLEMSTRLILHEGQPVGVQGLARDITERKRVEKERERLLRIQTALSQAGKALLGTLDLDELLGKILDGVRQAIPAAEKGSVLLWDEAKKTLQVRKTSGYQDPRVAGVVLDVRQGYSVQAALQRKPVIVADVQAEPAIRYEGEIAEMAVIRSALAAPLIARDRLLGVISLDANAPGAFTADDMELLVAFSGHAALALEDSSLYEQMNQSRETYRIVSDLVSDWAYSIRIEPDGRHLNEWVTEAFVKISGYTLEEMEAHGGWRTVIHPEDKEVHERRWQALMKGDPDISEYRILTKDGDVRWIRDYGRPVWDAHQKRVTRIYGAAQNITDRQVLESQLRQAQKMEAVGRLAGGVAHDFNNLLMVIRGYTELLLEQISAESPLRRSAEQIEKAADRAASLTQQLLAYSRRQVLAPQVLDMNAVVEGVHAMLRRLIAEHIELTMALEPALGRVKADRSQVEQVILNLVINARDAMPKGGKITVETGNVVLDHAYVRQHPGTRPGRHVMLAVSDTGVGIPQEDQAHIFEPFFTTKAAGKGTGLGLATVYGIVKQSDGSIWVYSEPGLGTTFKVYLPRVEDAVEARDAHTEPQASEPRSETILVVEDEEHVRELACQFLGNRGYRVLSAGSGPQALEVSAKHPGTIDVLVTDVIMPGMSGRELAERLTPLRPEMKVLYVSGYTQEAIGHHGVLDPDTAFLQKPFSSETLARKLREILDANGRKQPSSSRTNPSA